MVSDGYQTNLGAILEEISVKPLRLAGLETLSGPLRS